MNHKAEELYAKHEAFTVLYVKLHSSPNWCRILTATSSMISSQMLSTLVSMGASKDGGHDVGNHDLQLMGQSMDGEHDVKNQHFQHMGESP